MVPAYICVLTYLLNFSICCILAASRGPVINLVDKKEKEEDKMLGPILQDAASTPSLLPPTDLLVYLSIHTS